MGRRRDSTGTALLFALSVGLADLRDAQDQVPLTIPRKLSLSNMQGPLASPRDGALPSPRTRVGLTPGFDGVLSETWSARRRNAELAKANGQNKNEKDGDGDGKGPDLKEQEEEALHGSGRAQKNGESTGGPSSDPHATYNGNDTNGMSNRLNGQLEKLSINGPGDTQSPAAANPDQPPPGLGDLSTVEWSYVDPQGNVQGKPLW